MEMKGENQRVKREADFPAGLSLRGVERRERPFSYPKRNVNGGEARSKIREVKLIIE